MIRTWANEVEAFFHGNRAKRRKPIAGADKLVAYVVARAKDTFRIERLAAVDDYERTLAGSHPALHASSKVNDEEDSDDRSRQP